jgi:hypothetical protein
VRLCNSEIAPNGPFGAHAEIHTDMRQLPAKPSRRRDIAHPVTVRNSERALKGENLFFVMGWSVRRQTAGKLSFELVTADWIEAEQRRWPAMTVFECIADEICAN